MGVRTNETRQSSKSTGEDLTASSLKAVELFCGIGGFRLAADSLGIETVWANDFCPKACEVYRSMFSPDVLHEGDIIGAAHTIPAHSLLTGGFPCQPFSSAGKKHGIRDPRGTLFQAIVDVLRDQNPTFFVLENVKRLLTMENGLHFATILSSLAELDYHIEWRLLNAMDFNLPQNRQRVFIVGVRKDLAPSNQLRLLSSQNLERFDGDQIDCLEHESCWSPIGSNLKRFPSWGVASNGVFYGADLSDFTESSPVVPLHTVLQDEVPAEFDFTESTIERCLSNSPVNRFVQGVEIISNQAGGARMGYTIFGVNGVAPTLTSATSRHYERYSIGGKFRRLTNIEYARIQGFSDDHCSAVSVYDQYSLIGNSVPPPMARWVLGRLLAKGINRTQLPKHNTARNLFNYAR